MSVKLQPILSSSDTLDGTNFKKETPKTKGNVVIHMLDTGSVNRECVSTAAAGACTRRSLGHHLSHLLILRLLVLCSPADFEAQSSLL